MRAMVRKIIIILFIATSLGIPMKLFAKIGVGIGTGKIQVDQELKPGAIYSIPSVAISNTGDEGADYEVVVQYHSNIPQLSPDKNWFSFSPQSFHLEPKESQVVEISLELSVKAKPGNYFAYIEGRPAKKETSESGAKIGVAAAAKLYFTIEPANLFSGILNKIASYWKHYAPWTYIFVLILILAIIVLLLRRFFAFNVGVKLKKKENGKENFQETDIGANEVDFVLLQSALGDVERYYEKMTERELETLFAEAKKHRLGISTFFYHGDRRVLSVLNPNSREVLILAYQGLEKIKREEPRSYERSLKMVMEGLLGL